MLDLTQTLEQPWNVAGFFVKRDEWIVVGVVLVGLFLFEAGPKLLNFVKNRRSSKGN